MWKKKRKLKPEITKQNILEKLAEVYLSFGEFRFALPWIFMMASVIILILLQGWLIPLEFLPRIVNGIFALTLFGFLILFTDIGLDIFFLCTEKKRTAAVLQFITTHSGCSYDDIMQNCISFKIHCLLDEPLKKLMHDFDIVAESTPSGQPCYRLPTEEEIEQRRKEQEYWEQVYWEEEENAFESEEQ